MSPEPGTRLCPYEIAAELGGGGMGEVYRARDTRLEREVAVKVLPEIFAQDPERLAPFEREARPRKPRNGAGLLRVSLNSSDCQNSIEGRQMKQSFADASLDY
jgi:serine/threonine protein kinase